MSTYILGSYLKINDWSEQDKKNLGIYLQWNSYRSERYKLFYVATPKVACTTLKWWFAALEGYSQELRQITANPESALDLVVHHSHLVAPNVTGLSLPEISEALNSDSYFRFAVVRNPYKRIFSAWQSKLLLREPLQVRPYVNADFYHHPINVAADIAKSFEGFLEHLAENEAPSYWDHHWTPQADLLRPDLINYSCLVKIEESKNLDKRLSEWLGKYITSPFQGRRSNESLIPYSSEFVTERSAELIRTLFAHDFDLFGYDKKPPEVKDTFSIDQLDTAIKAINFIRARHKSLTERDSQIVGLNHMLSERNGQITSLSQAVTERDSQIVGLNHMLSERNGQINFQNESIQALLQSRSWKLTKPLRTISGQIRTVTKSMRIILNNSSARIPVIRQISIRRIRLSHLFDEKFYRERNHDVKNAGIDPATHYYIFGWNEHRDPSKKFSTHIYLENNPDVAAAGINPLLHYIKYGKAEGRQIQAVAVDFDADLSLDVAAAGIDPYNHYLNNGMTEGRLGHLPNIPGLDTLQHLDPQRETVLVVCHEGSRTGAPILGYNLVRELLCRFNVVTLFLGPGPMLEASRALGAVVLGPTTHDRHPLIVDRMIAAILERATLSFAIINSVEARFPLVSLTHRNVPTVSLIHEFAAYTRPGGIAEAVLWSDITVFSSRLTRDNAWACHAELRGIAFPVIPQGRCYLPEASSAPGQHLSVSALTSVIRPDGFSADGLVVLGLGTVQLRKGVDLFLECASRVCRSAPDLPIRFVWIGKGYDPENDAQYSVYLADQIQRAGLAKRVQFIDEVPDLQDVYAAADLLLLSSRLDPLPNVAIDALSEGLPVICFDRATGIADILRDHGLAEHCVAPYLDTAHIAEQILAIARSPSLHQELAERAAQVAATTFQMPRYVGDIVTLAERAREKSRQQAEDIATIRDANILISDYVLQPGITADADLAVLYVRSWASGVTPRKPFPGFHPGVYRERHGLAQPDADPLADYLRQGRPEGPWLLPLITPDTPARGTVREHQRIALHVHAFYPDLVAPILEAIGQNQTRMDLLVSVVDEEDHYLLAPLFQNYRGGRVEMRTVKNRGRDLGPFCTAFADTILRNYDLVGHIHTKRSPEIGAEASQQWVRFLMSNLLGGSVPMADRILATMTIDSRIGMVFPDDPYILSWGENRPHAEALAQRLGISQLPESIVFPVGSMFWARVSALEPLLTLGLTWADYPEEPVPYDGTMLHALERLLPLIATKTGHTLALSQVPGVVR